MSERLKNITDQISVIDNQIRDIMRGSVVIQFSDFEYLKTLRKQRRYLVDAIHATARAQGRS